MPPLPIYGEETNYAENRKNLIKDKTIVNNILEKLSPEILESVDNFPVKARDTATCVILMTDTFENFKRNLSTATKSNANTSTQNTYNLKLINRLVNSISFIAAHVIHMFKMISELLGKIKVMKDMTKIGNIITSHTKVYMKASDVCQKYSSQLNLALENAHVGIETSLIRYGVKMSENDPKNIMHSINTDIKHYI